MQLSEKFVLGIDFGGTKVALATFDGHGRVLESDRHTFAPGWDAEQIVADAIERAIVVLERTEQNHPELAGAGGCAAVGVSSPGIVLPDRVLLAPNVTGWHDLALAARLRAGLGIEPVVGTDVKAAAAAELRWGSLREQDHAIYLNLGTGIAAALVVNGAVVHGANGAAGELAYNLDDPDGAWDGVRSGRSPLEEIVSGRAIGVRGAELTGAPPSARAVFERARTDPAAARLIDTALRHLALHVVNLAIAVDPAVIAVGGGLMAAADRILPVLREAVQAAVPFPPQVTPAHFLHDAALRGAAAMALDGVGPQPVAS
jgi:glucokinase